MANIISDETIAHVGILAQLELSEEEREQARADMKELYNVRANVEHLLDIPTGRESQRDTQKLRQ